MSKRIGRLAAIITATFVLLVANLTYLQFIAASELTAKPENVRPILYEQKFRRGDIISADNKVLATSKKVADSYKRYYAEGSVAAPVTGFYSTKYGRSGLELTFDEQLSGQSYLSSVDAYIKRLLGKDVPGNNLYLSINMDIQRLADKLLGDRKGAVIALNPKTGAVIALVSKPSYNPNDIDNNWSILVKSPDGPMLNRATQGKFTPGSSFKIITAAAALENSILTTDTVFDAPANIKIYGGKVTNYEKKGFGKITFADAFARSVNTVFAQVGKSLGGGKLVDAAENFGFGRKTPFDIPAGISHIPRPSDMDELEVAWMAVGQGRIQATPLTMALACSAIANNGKIMRPYLVEKIQEPNGNVAFQREPRVWLSPIKPETAQVLRGLMEKVVDEGTGKAAKIPGVRVAGKTGTAEVGNGEPHAWFVGFAPAEDPQVLVAAVVENGGTGGRTAAPIAREIMMRVLGAGQ
ncbi:MAG: cell division protein FtsI [Firmicutes bacterium]|nr:cell division protein FtsI [Bacillota bacterium]